MNTLLNYTGAKWAMLDAEEVKKMGFEDRQCWEDDRSEEEEFDEDRAYEEHREWELFGD